MNEILKFRRMVTPVIVQVLFWIGVVVVVLAGLVMIFTGAPGVPRAQSLGTGILMIVLGPIGVRIYAELLIVIFRINETLTDVSQQLERGNRPV